MVAQPDVDRILMLRLVTHMKIPICVHSHTYKRVLAYISIYVCTYIHRHTYIFKRRRYGAHPEAPDLHVMLEVTDQQHSHYSLLVPIRTGQVVAERDVRYVLPISTATDGSSVLSPTDQGVLQSLQHQFDFDGAKPCGLDKP